MSFVGKRSKIRPGDLVILYVGHDRMYPLTVKCGSVFQTRFGAVRHSELVGRRFGAKIPLPKGFLHVLKPTPELWTLNLPHRTQILHNADISMIIFQLDLRPGSVCVEAGTGSGSLSHALLRTLAPFGHLYTFDFHAERVLLAQREFQEHGFGDMVTVQCRDVCSNGTGNGKESISADDETKVEVPGAKRPKTKNVKECKLADDRVAAENTEAPEQPDAKRPKTDPEKDVSEISAEPIAKRSKADQQKDNPGAVDKVIAQGERPAGADTQGAISRRCDGGFGLDHVADAAFLDLPSPWLAVKHLKQALKLNATCRVCCFSPCIEQTQRTCQALLEEGFADLRTLETLSRQHYVRTVNLPVADIGQNKVRDAQNTRVVMQPDVPENQDKHATGFHKNSEISVVACGASHTNSEGVSQISEDKPAVHCDASESVIAVGRTPSASSTPAVDGPPMPIASMDSSKIDQSKTDNGVTIFPKGSPHGAGKGKVFYAGKKPKLETRSYRCLMPANQMVGHTGYLTFATLYGT